MKKKYIAIIIIFVFSFGILSNLQKEKEVNAIAIGIGGGVAIAKVIGILLAGATLGVGGYVIGDNAINPDDNSEFTDWITGEYLEYIRYGQQLPGQPPPDPKQLTTAEQIALNSLLTKNGIEVGTELYDIMNDYFTGQLENNNIPDPSTSFININPINYGGYYVLNGKFDNYITTYYSNNLFYALWKDTAIGKVFKINLSSPLNTFIYAIPVFEKVLNQTNFMGQVAHGMKIISKDNSVSIIPLAQFFELVIGDNSLSGRWGRQNPGDHTVGHITLNTDYVPPVNFIPDQVKPPISPVLPENYTPTFKGIDLTALNGLVSSAEEMEGIINGSIQVTPQRYKQIEDGWNKVLQDYLNNPNFQGLPDTPKEPITNPTTGLLDFGDIPAGPILDPENIPDDLSFFEKAIFWLKGIWYAINEIPKGIIQGLKDLYNLLNTWLNQFWTKLNEVIDDFWMTFTDWWQNNFIYPWNTFQAWLQGLWDGFPATLNDLYENVLLPPLLDINDVLLSIGEDLALIPGLIGDLVQPVLDIPGMIVTWFVPPPNEWEDVWEPLILLWHDKIEPIKSPFENLAFYSSEYEDVSVSLEFNGVGGYFKILDYQYIKSYREPVKNIIRSFFWILLIFYNLDQVHRLIRNQGIIKTYVRKIEPPEGNKR